MMCKKVRRGFHSPCCNRKIRSVLVRIPTGDEEICPFYASYDCSETRGGLYSDAYALWRKSDKNNLRMQTNLSGVRRLAQHKSGDGHPFLDRRLPRTKWRAYSLRLQHIQTDNGYLCLLASNIASGFTLAGIKAKKRSRSGQRHGKTQGVPYWRDPVKEFCAQDRPWLKQFECRRYARFRPSRRWILVQIEPVV